MNIKLQGGVTHGGIIENKDLDAIENVEPDAYSGATKAGFNVGAHAIIPVRRNAIETGIDYSLYNQTFTYKDAINNFDGSRQIFTSQFAIPLTYNFTLFRNLCPEKDLQLKLGYLAAYNLYSVKDKDGTLPEYDLQPFSQGLTLGLSATPVEFKNSSKLGLYLDFYRGSQVYEDFYNQTSFDMPGTSIFKFGIAYQF